MSELWQRRACFQEVHEKTQNVNAVDDSSCACEQNVHRLFILDIQPVRVVQCRLGKSLLALFKLSVATNRFVWKTRHLGTASANQYGGVGRGVITPMARVELVCETQGKCYSLEFQLSNKKVVGSQPPQLSGSDCVNLGVIEIKGSNSLIGPSVPNSKDMIAST